MLSEEEVYNGTKRWLINNEYKVIAGQPARGVDHLPVIEIKCSTGEKGSRNSYKPDLIAYKAGMFFIIECKPSFDYNDYNKIKTVLNSNIRRLSLFKELQQYNLLDKIGFPDNPTSFQTALHGMLAFSGKPGAPCDMHKLIVVDWKGTATIVEPST